MRHFPTAETRAAAYVAYKELERMLDEDGVLAPDSCFDLSGVTVEVTIPNGTSVARDGGKNGDGKIWKTATQNLYGYSILHQCFRVAAKFKQQKTLRRILRGIVRRAIKQSISSEKALLETNPNAAEELKALKATLDLPQREEDTPRKINRKNGGLFPTIAIHPAKARRKAS